MNMTGRVVVTNKKDFEVQEHKIPSPPPHGILLRQELAGICGTDLHMWQNGLQVKTVLGHENVGVIVAMGDEVTSDHVGRPLREGDRIVFAPGTKNGVYGFLGPEKDPCFHGGFSDYIALYLENTCYLKTDLPPEVAVLTEPFTIGVHAAMRAGIEIGDTVVVQGSGAIGLLTVACAKISGAGKIIVIGGPEDRLSLAKMMGADIVINIEEVPSIESRKELVLGHTQHQGGADVVFECAGFLPATIEGMGYVRYGGTFVEVGHYVDMGSIEMNINRLMMKRNMRIEAIWGSTYEHFTRGLPILEKNEFPFRKMISHILPLDKVEAGFKALNGDYRLGDETVIKIAVAGNSA